jgi:hypothetical protein
MPDNLTEPAQPVCSREEGRWRRYGHWQPIDAMFLGVLCEVIAQRERLLAQIRDEHLEQHPIALEMLREYTEQIDKWERELLLRR